MVRDSFRSSTAGQEVSGELRLDVAACPAACKSVIASAVAGRTFVRRVAARSREAVVGQFPSFKMGSTFPAESDCEAGILMLADVHEDVRAFRPQALRVSYRHGGRTVSACPDIAVVRTDGYPELWECKPNRGVGRAAFHRLRDLHDALQAVGIRYRVRQPFKVLREPRRRNATLLWRHADCHLPDGLAVQAEDAVQTGVPTLGMLASRTGASFPMLLALAARGHIAVDIGLAPLGHGSLVRMPVPGATSGAFDATDAASGNARDIIRPT